MGLRVVLVDDHPVVLDGLRQSLGVYSDITVVAIGNTGADALRLARVLAPEVLLLDIHLPDVPAHELVRSVRSVTPSTRILLLTGYDDPLYTKYLMDLGAAACVTKATPGKQVATAIRRVAGGGVWKVGISASPSLIEPLTPRETEVVTLVLRGLRNAEIAEELVVTLKAVEYHMGHILAKVGARSRAELILKVRDLMPTLTRTALPLKPGPS